MNELLKITVTDDQKQTVSGRDLHMFLEIPTDYPHWFTRMCEYGFTEGKDFQANLSESTGGRPQRGPHHDPGHGKRVMHVG